MKRQFYYLAMVAMLFSCKKELKNELSNTTTVFEKQNSKTVFSKALAIAIEKEPTLRVFIKNEALKQFDLDNDVLFQMVKDEKVVSDKTFYDLLSQYAQSKEELDAAINSSPTLTIMIPELPYFSPANWNANLEIPLVAVSPASNNFNAINLYNSKGEVTKIESGSVPAFPVLVVKENERVNVTVNNVDRSPVSSVLLRTKGSSAEVFLEKENMKFSFSNDAFNGMSSNGVDLRSLSNKMMSASRGKVARVDGVFTGDDNTITKSSNPIDPLVIKAFDSNLDWQRDFVYYGLNPSEGKNKGKFNNRVVEHIVAIRMKDGEFNRISDHSVDPTVNESWHVPPGRSEGRFVTNWTDGYFDIRISILINAKNGAGTQLNKVISAKGSDLYDIAYKCERLPGRPTTPGSCRFDKVTPKNFFINEPLVSWNLENYGAAWKFIVSEYDPSEEIITTYNESTKFASNFGFDIGFGETVKIGYKFGSSMETTSSSTYQYKTTRGSDELGEGIMEFGSPIILRKEVIRPDRGAPGTLTNYVTNEISCGSIYLCVEPKQL